MKAYIVTVTDEAAKTIDFAIDAAEEIFLGPWVEKFPVNDIQEVDGD